MDSRQIRVEFGRPRQRRFRFIEACSADQDFSEKEVRFSRCGFEFDRFASRLLRGEQAAGLELFLRRGERTLVCCQRLGTVQEKDQEYRERGADEKM